MLNKQPAPHIARPLILLTSTPHPHAPPSPPAPLTGSLAGHTHPSILPPASPAGRPCVLGLATGSSPMHVYRELVRMHRHDGLSFRHVITFNLDEYYPMRPEALQASLPGLAARGSAAFCANKHQGLTARG